MKKQLQIAVYGKGGIGKSTMSANLSAALAMAGDRVMQIGCDPKHDSTRYLMHGEVIPTVLEYLRETPESRQSLSDVLREGCFHIGCLEAGGPKPGIGCAGRGIITAFEFLDRTGAKDPYERIIYDVLGDVVCGGFAVPVRREYADAVFLVTSGEYMALYAANNILRGIYNYDGNEGRRIAGILYNERRIPDEDERVRRFAGAVGLPVVAKIPRSPAFARAEEKNCTVMELDGFESEKSVFRGLAAQIDGDLRLYPARPLSDGDLEHAVLGTALPEDDGTGRNSAERQTPDEPLSVSVSGNNDAGRRQESSAEPPRRPALYGCAFQGAAVEAVHVTDAIVIAHGPRACAFYTWQLLTSSGRKNLFNRGILMPSAISPNYRSTDMGHAEAVFGGMDLLKSAVREAIARKPGAVIVISSCVSGIIGDDIRTVEEMSTPDIPVIAVPADGDIGGDYMTGIEMCTHLLVEKLADVDIPMRDDCVNLINETGVSNNQEINFRTVRSLLSRMGISINCRLSGDTTTEDLRSFFSAPLNLLADDTPVGRATRTWLEDNWHVRFAEGAFPIGFQATCRWLREISAFFHREDAAEQIIRDEKESYESEIASLRSVLSGKKILMTSINVNMDWFLEAAEAAGMSFVWIGVLNYLKQDIVLSDHPDRYPVEQTLDVEQIQAKARELKPDLILTNYTSETGRGDWLVAAMPMTQVAGFRSALVILQRLADLFENGKEGTWSDDRALFEKYYA